MRGVTVYKIRSLAQPYEPHVAGIVTSRSRGLAIAINSFAVTETFRIPLKFSIAFLLADRGSCLLSFPLYILALESHVAGTVTSRSRGLAIVTDSFTLAGTLVLYPDAAWLLCS